MKGIAICTILVAMVTGCSTITKGTDQRVSISTPACKRAICEIQQGNKTWEVRVPNVVELDRKAKGLALKCWEKDNEDNYVATREGTSAEWMSAGNILIGGFVGVGVDLISGAAFKYDDNIQVPLQCSKKSSIAIAQ